MEQTINDSTREQLREIQRAVTQKHPEWPYDKVRWITMQLANGFGPNLRSR